MTHPKLLRDSKTDVFVDRHKCRASRVSRVPIGSEPQVHPRTQAEVGSDSAQQDVAATAWLRDSGDPIILGVLPGERRPNEPFARSIFCFMRSIREPEARLDLAAQTCCLRPLRAHERMQIFIGHQPPYVEETGIGPVRADKEVSRTRTG